MLKKKKKKLVGNRNPLGEADGGAGLMQGSLVIQLVLPLQNTYYQYGVVQSVASFYSSRKETFYKSSALEPGCLGVGIRGRGQQSD